MFFVLHTSSMILVGVPVPLVANHICVFLKHCFSDLFPKFCSFVKMMQEKLFIVILILCYPFDEVKSGLKIER